jgi:glycerate 2-kinase
MPDVVIPQAALIASGPFGDALSAECVALAIAQGLRAGGAPEPDLCPIPVDRGQASDVGALDVGALLGGLDFDVRMRRARAVILGERQLEERALRGSVAFEIATRARQAGVPAYAVTGSNALDHFDARILDLQVIIEANSRRALVAAGKRLARLVGTG